MRALGLGGALPWAVPWSLYRRGEVGLKLGSSREQARGRPEAAWRRPLYTLLIHSLFNLAIASRHAPGPRPRQGLIPEPTARLEVMTPAFVLYIS